MGHGTEMAGLAAYGDLLEPFLSGDLVRFVTVWSPLKYCHRRVPITRSFTERSRRRRLAVPR